MLWAVFFHWRRMALIHRASAVPLPPKGEGKGKERQAQPLPQRGKARERSSQRGPFPIIGRQETAFYSVGTGSVQYCWL